MLQADGVFEEVATSCGAGLHGQAHLEVARVVTGPYSRGRARIGRNGEEFKAFIVEPQIDFSVASMAGYIVKAAALQAIEICIRRQPAQMLRVPPANRAACRRSCGRSD